MVARLNFQPDHGETPVKNFSGFGCQLRTARFTSAWPRFCRDLLGKGTRR